MQGNEFGSHTPANQPYVPSIVISGLSGATISNNYFETAGGNGNGFCSHIFVNGRNSGNVDDLLSFGTASPSTGVVLSANYHNGNDLACKVSCSLYAFSSHMSVCYVPDMCLICV